MDVSNLLSSSQMLVLLVAVVQLMHLGTAGQLCTSGFTDPVDKGSDQQSQLVPLLGRFESFGAEQWIFPNLQFTCRQTLTKWRFQGTGSRASRCRAELATWRLDATYTFSTVLRQVSTTEGNTAKTTESAENGGSLFTYELAMPIQVQPGDMVGVEIFCPGIQPSDKLNILSLDVSESGSSSALAYKRSGSGSLLFLETSLIFREQNYLPLIEAVTDAPSEPDTTVSLLATTSPTEDGTSGPGVATTITNFIGEDIIDGDLITVQIGDGEINKRTLKIIVILATFSFTVTILAIVTVCVSVVCVKKHANKHKCANGEEKHSNTEAGLDSSTPIGSGTLLHNNSAYNRTSNIAQSIINREEWLPSNASTYYYVSQSETYEEIDSSSDSEGYEKVSMQQSRNENCNSMVGCVIYSKSNSDREPLDSSTEAYNSVTGTRSELHRYDADTVYVDPENEADAIRDSSEDTKMSTNIAYNGRSIVAHETDTDTTTDQQERNLDHDECHYEHIL